MLPVHPKALLALADGTVLTGVSIGATGQTTGEVVFNTSLTGYQEILTDPSYCRQIVTLTYPHIGNTGVNREDVEADRIHAAGLIIKDLPLLASNFRSEETLSAYLQREGTVAIADLDTRALTRRLRTHGAQNGCIVALPAGEAITDAHRAAAVAAAKAAPSAKYLQNAFGNYNDGVYWINLTYVGPTQIYCILNTAIDGGGWMMMMKATRGTTFYYGSTYWTAVNTLNSISYNRNDGDAKFDAMNYFYAKDMMALWPDIASKYGSGNGGSVNLISSYNNWCWLQNNFNNGIRITPVDFFNSAIKLYFKDASTFSGKGPPFSSQTDVRFYGYNYTSGNGGDVRWGFGWNENGGGLYPNGVEGSNDVSGGIGMSGVFTTGVNYSAGDQITCCQNGTGIIRSARVEIYVR